MFLCESLSLPGENIDAFGEITLPFSGYIALTFPLQMYSFFVFQISRFRVQGSQGSLCTLKSYHLPTFHTYSIINQNIRRFLFIPNLLGDKK